MSGLGHEPKYQPDSVTSALPLKADIPVQRVDVGFVPTAEVVKAGGRPNSRKLARSEALDRDDTTAPGR